MHRKIGDTNELMNKFIWKTSYYETTNVSLEISDKPWLFESNSCTCGITFEIMMEFWKNYGGTLD